MKLIMNKIIQIQNRIDFLNEDSNENINPNSLREFWRLYEILKDEIDPSKICSTPENGLYVELKSGMVKFIIRNN